MWQSRPIETITKSDVRSLLHTSTGDAPVSGYGKIKKRMDDWIIKHQDKKNFPPMPSWVLHDLRRTMVTMMTEKLKISPPVIEACVNHISGAAKMGVAGVYNKALYVDERESAFRVWGTYIEKLVNN